MSCKVSKIAKMSQQGQRGSAEKVCTLACTLACTHSLYIGVYIGIYIGVYIGMLPRVHWRVQQCVLTVCTVGCTSACTHEVRDVDGVVCVLPPSPALQQLYITHARLLTSQRDTQPGKLSGPAQKSVVRITILCAFIRTRGTQ